MELKNVLIISPYFPPVNAADMHRVRTNLPYFEEYGWNAEVVTVDDRYTDMNRDNLLLQSVSKVIKIHYVKALNKKWTSKFGLGSIALRSMWYYRKSVNQLLRKHHYDLIYFSTTQFPICVLGAYWKRKFKVPYVIDVQDPWHSDYYQDKFKNQRPAKYWFSYRLNKYLEPLALKKADGLISVSNSYIDDLKTRYPQIKDIPAATITFGIFKPDLEIALAHQSTFKQLLNPGTINIVYVGRGGADMYKAIVPVFVALSVGLKSLPEVFENLRFYFIGTSYAPAGQGRSTILPLAKDFDLEDRVVEITDRIGYYDTLNILKQADALFIPGSDDSKYTASKIFPYLLAEKPILGLFNAESSAIRIFHEFGIDTVYDYDTSIKNVNRFFINLVGKQLKTPDLPTAILDKHSARTKTRLQCELFNQVITNAAGKLNK